MQEFTLCPRLVRRLFGFVLCLSSGLAHAAGQSPSTPANLTASVNGTSVSLTWSASTDDDGVEGYNVYRDDSYLTTVQSTSYTGTIDPNRLTQFTVSAFDGAPRQFSMRSDSVSVPSSLVPTDLTIPPSQPSGLAGTFQGNQLTLTWTASTDDEAVRGYNVYRDNRYLDTVETTRWVGSVNPNTIHRWSVVAFDIRQNFSPQSDAIRLPDNGPNRCVRYVCE